MKLLSTIRIASALIVFITLNESCRKPKDPPKPKDPCANSVLVQAVEASSYYCGHFTLIDPSGMPNSLYAVNWSSYAAKVLPGKKYRIAYDEVSCPTRKDEEYMDCGCFAPPMKCIKIRCLEPVTYYNQPRGCLFSEMNPLGFSEKFSHALAGTGIYGNEFRLKVGYSGCDRSEIRNFRLALQETRFRCPEPKLDRVFLARVVTDDHMVCQAYFEEKVCFDLSNLRSYMVDGGYDMSESVVIRLQYRDGTEQDFTYQP